MNLTCALQMQTEESLWIQIEAAYNYDYDYKQPGPASPGAHTVDKSSLWNAINYHHL